MQIQAIAIASAPADPDHDDLAYLHFRGADGYVLSLSRLPGAELIEVMVQDQINCKTNDLRVKLSARSLHVAISESVAAQLNGVKEFEVVFAEGGAHAHQINEALHVIFSGVGRYENAL